MSYAAPGYATSPAFRQRCRSDLGSGVGAADHRVQQSVNIFLSCQIVAWLHPSSARAACSRTRSPGRGPGDGPNGRAVCSTLPPDRQPAPAAPVLSPLQQCQQVGQLQQGQLGGESGVLELLLVQKTCQLLHPLGPARPACSCSAALICAQQIGRQAGIEAQVAVAHVFGQPDVDQLLWRCSRASSSSTSNTCARTRDAPHRERRQRLNLLAHLRRQAAQRQLDAGVQRVLAVAGVLARPARPSARAGRRWWPARRGGPPRAPAAPARGRGG